MPHLPLPPEHEHCLTAAGVREHMRHTAAMRRARRMAPAPHWWTCAQPKQPKPVARKPAAPPKPGLSDEQKAQLIIKAVGEYFGPEDLLKYHIKARYALAYLLRSYTQLTLAEIGKYIDCRHSATCSAVQSARASLNTQPDHLVTKAILALKPQMEAM